MQKREMKALDRIAKKISDAEGHLTKIEDSIDDKKHCTAQHETIKDIKSTVLPMDLPPDHLGDLGENQI